MIFDPEPCGKFKIVHNIFLNEFWDTDENKKDEKGFCGKTDAREVAIRECDCKVEIFKNIRGEKEYASPSYDFKCHNTAQSPEKKKKRGALCKYIVPSPRDKKEKGEIVDVKDFIKEMVAVPAEKPDAEFFENHDICAVSKH